MLVLILFFFREVACDKWKTEYNTLLAFTTPHYKQLHTQISVLEKTFIVVMVLKIGVTCQLMVGYHFFERLGKFNLK